MDSFTNFSLNIYSDKTSEGAFIEANISNGSKSSSNALERISFYFTRKEFENLLEGKVSSVNDIVHNLRCFGDEWLFYDINFPETTCGTMTVPYRRVIVPTIIQKLMLRVARMTWTEFASNAKDWKQTKTFDLSSDTRKRWIKMYGHGKGEVTLDIPEGLSYRIESDRDDVDFERSLQHIIKIAKNTTHAYFDRARVTLSADGNSYYWVAYGPNGRAVMNGGLINHGTEAPDWKIHT